MRKGSLSDRDSPKLPFIDASEERIFQRKQALVKQKQTIEQLESAAKRQFVEDQHDLAYATGTQLLKVAIEAYGMSSVQLISPYVLIGSAALGLEKIPQAEKYLSQAQWILLRHPGCDATFTSLVCRHLGLLYMSQGNYERARKMIADDIYHLTMKYGIDDVRVAMGYYHLGNSFIKEGRLVVAVSLHDRVIQMYLDYFQSDEVAKATEFALNENEEIECDKMLQHIRDAWEDDPDDVKSESFIRLYKCLALLHDRRGNKALMLEYADKAMQVNQSLPTPSAQLVQDLTALINASRS
ncbi:zinc finger MYND domain-containing protein 12-like isoform X2 [Oscarella lobularis]|uniref:zinc finger MYND domain-containing protein 12-like isoform X2 n=1 Tax=Oscarella lobularis TaxID=121494 RepID=UPI003313475A